MATPPPNTVVQTSSNTPGFDPSIPRAVPNPRPKPKARAKGKGKAPAQDDSLIPQNSLEDVNSQEGPIASTSTAREVVEDGITPKPEKRRNNADTVADTTGLGSHDIEATVAVAAPKERPKPRPKPKKKADTSASAVESTALRGTIRIHTPGEISTEHDATPSQSAPSTSGKKRKANDMELASTAPPSKKVRAVTQPDNANGPGSNTTTEANVTSSEVMEIDASPRNPGQLQLRRGRSRKGLPVTKPRPTESAPTDIATNDATTAINRGRGRRPKAQVTT
jgi:hypothetical protein